eukprot:Gb_39641 [translate_table: standard]
MASLAALVEGELGSPFAHVAFPPLFQTKEFFIKQCKVPELRIDPSVVEEEVQELQEWVLENLETDPVTEEVEAHRASVPLNPNKEEDHLAPEPSDESDSESQLNDEEDHNAKEDFQEIDPRCEGGMQTTTRSKTCLLAQSTEQPLEDDKPGSQKILEDYFP